MASRKQRRKARIRASARAARRPAVDFIQLVRQALAENNGRRALDALKQAEKSQRAPEGLDALFYCAAACRSRNLAEKGMHKEAAAMRARAVQYRSAVRVAELAPEDLRLFLASLEPPDAMATYAVQASGGSRETHVERMLADRLVVDRCWDALEKMGSEHPFRMDAESAKPAVLAMEGGDWVDAAEAFRKVGRRSPFAPWRVFCKAMVHFGEGDAENLKRAVSQLPDDFVMAGTVAAWKEPDGWVRKDSKTCSVSPVGGGATWPGNSREPSRAVGPRGESRNRFPGLPATCCRSGRNRSTWICCRLLHSRQSDGAFLPSWWLAPLESCFRESKPTRRWPGWDFSSIISRGTNLMQE